MTAYKRHEYYLARAFEQAAKGYSQNGCPIGGVLMDNDTGEVLGAGCNALVQEGNPILHGEMAACALRAVWRTVTTRPCTRLFSPALCALVQLCSSASPVW